MIKIGDKVKLISTRFSDKPYVLSNKVKISRRMFGIELETIHNGIDEREIQNLCMSNRNNTYVDFKRDSSIEEDDEHCESVEVITRPLTSRKGLERIASLCKILSDRDMTVNASCGYHVHLSTGTIFGNIQKMKATILFYWLFEGVFFSFLPRSRGDNSYCRKLQSIYGNLPHLLKNITTLKEFECMWYKEGSHYYVERKKKDHYDNSRYCWVNFHCLLAPSRNLEIRSHNGTLGPTKVINWIRLHDHILSAIRDNKITVKGLIAFRDEILSNKETSSLEIFTDAMMTMIDLPKDLCEYYSARQALFATQKPRQSIEEIDEPENIVYYDNDTDYSLSAHNPYLPANNQEL